MKKLLLIAMAVLLSSSIAFAQDFCEGDLDYDRDVDADDVSAFLADFGREPSYRACPPDGPAPMARTGQTIIHYPGDDGYWQQGVLTPEQRFTVNGDGSVTDNLTGLMWKQNVNLFGQRSWTQALDDVASLNFIPGGGYADWRLPNVRELQSILDYSQRDPALPAGNPFENIPLTPPFFWSATTKMGVEPSPFRDAYGVDLQDGSMAGYGKASNVFYVWPVRGGR